MRLHLRANLAGWTAQQVVRAILGSLVTEKIGPDEKLDPPSARYLLGPTWDYSGRAIFCDFDSKDGGAIGLPKPTASDPRSLAEAAHESFHALLHSRGDDHRNEFKVNDMAEAWLRANLEDPTLTEALATLELSRDSYRKQTPL